MRVFWIAVVMFAVGPAWAQSPSVAEQAAQQLADAAVQLEAAEQASDRIAALTATVRAYEAGLSAMRDGLVTAALRARELEGVLEAQNADLGEFLALLQTVSRHVDTQALVHPSGAKPTIQAGLMVSSFVPELQERAAGYEATLIELSDLTTVQKAGISTLENGVRGAREARLQLSEALVNRTDLPSNENTDAAALQALLNSSETLTAFANALTAPDVKAWDIPPSRWTRPVEGVLLRAFNTPDAAGVPRPGIIFETPVNALVISPASANVRFSGEISGQGTVVILEPEAGVLVILAGLAQSFVRQGQIVSQDEAIGLMGGKLSRPQEKLNDILRNSSLLGAETLYMEVRQGLSPIDPADLLKPDET
ncbi:peptidoglycan DD-metalloendopeptidase family protein [Rhodobacteraceae bacterium]|nr:peptidoglycan DD-metalloendopeptidase family protein [Paracoccaceae bacterium]